MENETEKHRTIRTRDQLSGMVCVAVIFTLCTGICMICLSGSIPIRTNSHKDIVIKKLERQQIFRETSACYQPLCDSIYEHIERFNPAVNISFEENDIKALIHELKSLYEQNAQDSRYKVFYHVAVFYEMWFADKQILWSKKSNLEKFSRSLEQCQIRLAKREGGGTN
ncbi:MAG: type VI secretion system transmembrane protein TssO [Bacteroidales bacterium]